MNPRIYEVHGADTSRPRNSLLSTEIFPTPFAQPRAVAPHERKSKLPTSVPIWNHAEKIANPDAWKPPHEWDVAPPREHDHRKLPVGGRIPKLPMDGTQDEHFMNPDLASIQREVQMMMAASPELVLANLKSVIADAPDAMIYREHEMTKKRWLLSVLHRGEGYVDLERQDGFVETLGDSRCNRTLALYENQGTSYLFLRRLVFKS